MNDSPETTMREDVLAVQVKIDRAIESAAEVLTSYFQLQRDTGQSLAGPISKQMEALEKLNQARSQLLGMEDDPFIVTIDEQRVAVGAAAEHPPKPEGDVLSFDAWRERLRGDKTVRENT